MNCCPHCNRPYPPDVNVGGVFRQKLYEFVKANPHGVRRQQIEDAVYGDDPMGGPLFMQQSIYVMIAKINRRLKAHGFRLTAGGRGGKLFRVIELKPAHRPNILSRAGFGTTVHP